MQSDVYLCHNNIYINFNHIYHPTDRYLKRSTETMGSSRVHMAKLYISFMMQGRL